MALLVMIQSAYDIRHAQSDFTSIIESQADPLDLDSEAHPDIIPSTAMSRRLFLISFVLCTLILICSIDVSLASLASLIAFLVTAPGHLAF
ncbi:hypothetical protein LshimejAT787_0901320 [Lyophyllum shimeji]|uniref:Uncharacterized protein n=1 Tax=Lyophyllum shimeji TaxID=47721 RepID=A0A9P3UQ48_LYOSH|nr:hypothetical protein LshimejAT787_0901320 [Lyophyllum shimeji]